MYLYPRLPMFVAVSLAQERSARPLEELCSLSGILEHSAAWYSPTGGNRVTEEMRRDIQHRVRECAGKLGYPNPADESAKQTFDNECAAVLHDNMGISPCEASELGVWTYMTCVMLPDIVRWRFPGDGRTTIERFIGSDRGMRRNTFGRLWWRAYLLRLPQAGKLYELLCSLTEDELVQITERPSLAGSPALAKQVCKSFLQAVELDSGLSRRELIRDAVKRVRRLLPMLSFDVLDESTLQSTIDEVFLSSAMALSQEG